MQKMQERFVFALRKRLRYYFVVPRYRLLNGAHFCTKSKMQPSPEIGSKIKPKTTPSIKLMNQSYTKILAFGVAILLSVSAAHAQPFLLELNNGDGSVGEYNLDGSSINTALITGLNNPQFMTLVGDNLYIAEGGDSPTSQIGEYTIGMGANLGSVTAATDPLGSANLGNAYGIASDGTNLYVGEAFKHTVNEFNATTGAPVGTAPFATLPSNQLPAGTAFVGGNLYVADLSLNGPGSLLEYNSAGTLLNTTNTPGNPFSVVANSTGTDLFVGSQATNAIYEYTLGGTLIKTLVTGTLPNVAGMSDFDGDLYVTNFGNGGGANGYLNVYSDTTGALLTSNLITAPGGIVDVTIVAPEPSTWAMLLGGLGLLGFCARKRRTQV
jgi:hypothetical protein